MHQKLKTGQPRPVRKLAAVWLISLVSAFGLPRAAADTVPLPELRTAEQVRRLSGPQADLQYPVRLRGVITYFDDRMPTHAFHFIQDETAGIYFYTAGSTNNPPLHPGELVEIEGVTGAGSFAPVVTSHSIRILGESKLPEARRVTFEDLASGLEDSQLIEIHGLVREVWFDPPSARFLLDLATEQGRLVVSAGQLPVSASDQLVDNLVRITGVCMSRFNGQRQLFDIGVLVPLPEDLVIERPAPADPRAVPAQPIKSLLQYTWGGTYGHRVKVDGVVTLRYADKMYIQDDTEGICVETRQTDLCPVGDRVEILGFPSKGEYGPVLQNATYRWLAHGPVLPPDVITPVEALAGTHDCRLVQIHATLLDRALHSKDPFLVLQAGDAVFHAYLKGDALDIDLARLENGSKVAVTGVCVIDDLGGEWHSGTDWRAASFRLLLRFPGDVVVLAQPPWWNFKKMMWAMGILGLVVCSALAWVGILRRRVQKQTAIIRQRLQAEAALKERYENLLENASDVVFTHDLAGRITSINKAGEQLLRRHRGEILGHKLVRFVAVEQREAVTHWLAQAAEGQDLPAAEWDFLNADGQRVRLEISAGLLRQAGREPEVESVARDITERKGLEREILEISNREQRRIGYDLHDGVCQQLAAIAYRMDILGDQLQEKGLPESVETERIGALLQESIQQTRGVARGLFPVRLDESGLASALAELAANTSSFFPIQCRFFGEVQLSDKSVSLHLYYIAQEAVSNAIKHGRATQVTIAIAQTGDRLILTIEDNGAGFQLPMAEPTGMGLRIMRYRARMIGATLDLKSQPQSGTQITCALYKAA